MPNVEGERAGDRNGGDEGNGNVDGTMSGGGVHSRRVNAALLAADSQHVHWNQRT